MDYHHILFYSLRTILWNRIATQPIWWNFLTSTSYTFTTCSAKIVNWINSAITSSFCMNRIYDVHTFVRFMLRFTFFMRKWCLRTQHQNAWLLKIIQNKIIKMTIRIKNIFRPFQTRRTSELLGWRLEAKGPIWENRLDGIEIINSCCVSKEH